MSNTAINLSRAKMELRSINQDIQAKCDTSYRLQILQYNERNEEYAVYDDDETKGYDILLCLYHNDKCVSSVTGRYNKSAKSMELLSKTNKEYEGFKYNLYLRSIFIYLMFFIRPAIKTIFSYATNPVSTYAMYKHYRATNPELTEYLVQHGINPETFTLEHAKNFHDYYAKKHKHTDESAQEELETMLLDCSEVKGEECTVEDLGWDSEKNAIDFIKSTMSFNAITLELNLEHDSEGLKAFLLDKIRSTQIKCGASVYARGTRGHKRAHKYKKRTRKHKSYRNRK